jgi:plastocyanin
VFALDGLGVVKRLVVLFVAVLASAAPIACGSGDNSATSAGKAGSIPIGEKAKEVVKLEADPSGKLAYTLSDALVQEGKVTIRFKNPQAIPHDVAIEGPEGETIGQTAQVKEGEATTSVEVKPGTYHYYCTIPGHREAGMEGTLSVETL